MDPYGTKLFLIFSLPFLSPLLRRRRITPFTLFVFMALVGSSVSCRLSRDQNSLKPQKAGLTSDSSGGPLVEGELDSVVWLPAESSRAIQGYSDKGLFSCVPARHEDRCLPQPQSIKEACLAQKGTLSRCDDCREICDKPLPQPKERKKS